MPSRAQLKRTIKLRAADAFRLGREFIRVKSKKYDYPDFNIFNIDFPDFVITIHVDQEFFSNFFTWGSNDPAQASLEDWQQVYQQYLEADAAGVQFLDDLNNFDQTAWSDFATFMFDNTVFDDDFWGFQDQGTEYID